MRVSCTQYLHRSEHYIFYYRRAIPSLFQYRMRLK